MKLYTTNLGSGGLLPLCLTLILSSSLLWGQGEGEIVDKVQDQLEELLPEAAPGQTAKLPEVSESPEGDDSPLGIEIQALRLIAHQDRTDLEATFAIDEPVMVDEDLELPEGLTKTLSETYVGAELSMAKFERVTKDIVMAYRESDYPLVDVYLPEQNITKGKLQVVIREAQLGQVEVDGAKHSNPEYLKRQIRVAPGDRINSRVLERDIDWLNSNPSRRVDLIYERGEEDGTSDIVLKTEDLFPFGIYVNFGNTGIEATGQNEWASGFNVSNFLGTEHSIGYNFGADADLGNLEAHTLIYELPLPWRHRLQFIAAYVDMKAGSQDAILPLDIDGESIQGTGNYKILLPKLNGRHRQNFVFGTDYKSTNTDILFGGETFFDATAEVLQFRFGYDLTVGDKWGYTRFDLGSVYSPGGITHFNRDENFEALREGSDSTYWYLATKVDRYVKLPNEWGLKLSSKTQWTDDRLISTEQLLAGGYRSVRGVDENLARGDYGALLSAELQAPPLGLFGQRDREGTADSLSSFFFYDTAWLYSVGNLEAEPNQSIQTTGLGINYRLGDHLRARSSYGWVLSSSGIEDKDVSEGKFHFSVSVSY